jgi:hypothetical protein
MQPVESPAVTPWDVPAPVMFNTWKHHAGALRRRIAGAARRAEVGLADLSAELAVVGAKLMDLYTGPHPPAEVARRILNDLDARGRLDAENYCDWVDGQGGYVMLTLDDGSQWVLRVAEDAERFVHSHPGRWVPHTKRVRANVLRTAVMVLAFVGVHGGDPLDRALVNRVRQKYLGLSPVGREPDGEQALGEVIGLLRE